MAPYRIISFAELDSTNRHACAHLEDLADGDVVEAAVQTAGRGRLQRAWVSHLPGNLWMSIVTKPAAGNEDPRVLVSLSQLLALCVAQALEPLAGGVSLKWPNDVLVGGRKIAGILAESVVSGTRLQGLVLGLGLNVNVDAATVASIDQPATAVNLLTGRPADPAPLRDAILHAFFAARTGFLKTGFRAIRSEYARRLAHVGEVVEIRRPDGSCTGRVRGINDEGALELVQAGGQVRVVELGELFPVTNPGPQAA